MLHVNRKNVSTSQKKINYEKLAIISYLSIFFGSFFTIISARGTEKKDC